MFKLFRSKKEPDGWLTRLKHRRLLVSLMLLAVLIIMLGMHVFINLIPSFDVTFNNLTELEAFAGTLDEWIACENRNFYSPSYEQFFRYRYDSRWTRLGAWLKGFKRLDSSWFLHNLTYVTNERLSRGLHGDFIQKFQATEDMKIVVFGDVQGAFHSLTRCLRQLQKLEIIDEKFKLLKQNYFMVFIGNFINRSPFNLEVLSIMFQLMKNNPNNIIYLRGSNELYEVWNSRVFGNQMKYAFPANDQEKKDQLKEFFESLPLAAFGTIKGDNEGAIDAIAFYPFFLKEELKFVLNQNLYSSFLIEPQKEILDHYLLKKRINDSGFVVNDKLNIRAVITGILKRNDYIAMDGLRFLGKTRIGQGVEWTVLSSPVESFREFLGFDFDAFVIINQEKENNQWRISLYKRSVFDESLSFVERNQDLFTGQEI